MAIKQARLEPGRKHTFPNGCRGGENLGPCHAQWLKPLYRQPPCILSRCLCAAVQTLQPYIDNGLLEYHWVDKNRMGVKGKGMPPQLQVRIPRRPDPFPAA